MQLDNIQIIFLPLGKNEYCVAFSSTNVIVWHKYNTIAGVECSVYILQWLYDPHVLLKKLKGDIGNTFPCSVANYMINQYATAQPL